MANQGSIGENEAHLSDVLRGPVVACPRTLRLSGAVTLWGN